MQAADAVSAARPGARRENLENYIKRLEKLEEITSDYPGVEKSYAIQAGREVRVMVKPEQVSEDQMVILARELAQPHRERAGVSRSDQGPCSAGDQSGGVRQVKLVHKNAACAIAHGRCFFPSADANSARLFNTVKPRKNSVCRLRRAGILYIIR